MVRNQPDVGQYRWADIDPGIKSHVRDVHYTASVRAGSFCALQV
eukprot:SAG22_NODE_22307_length_222_cov_105.983740_1_plen_43_part_01